MKTLRGFIWGLLLAVSSLLVGLTAWWIYCKEHKPEPTSYGRYSQYRSK